MTVGFDRTADCQGNHPSLTEFLRILTEHYWLCFDRTTSLTEHLGNLGFDRTVNGEMFCQKNVISRVFCRILCVVMVSRQCYPRYTDKKLLFLSIDAIFESFLFVDPVLFPTRQSFFSPDHDLKR